MSNGKQSDLGFFIFIGIIIILLIPLLFGVNSINGYLQTQKRILLGITILGLVLLFILSVIIVKKKFNINLKKRKENSKKEKNDENENRSKEKVKPPRIIISNNETIEENVEITVEDREEIELTKLNSLFQG